MSDLGEETRNGGESLPRIETPRLKQVERGSSRATGRMEMPATVGLESTVTRRHREWSCLGRSAPGDRPDRSARPTARAPRASRGRPRCRPMPACRNSRPLSVSDTRRARPSEASRSRVTRPRRSRRPSISLIVFASEAVRRASSFCVTPSASARAVRMTNWSAVRPNRANSAFARRCIVRYAARRPIARSWPAAVIDSRDDSGPSGRRGHRGSASMAHRFRSSGNMTWAVWWRYRRQLAHSCPPVLRTQKLRTPYLLRIRWVTRLRSAPAPPSRGADTMHAWCPTPEEGLVRDRTIGIVATARPRPGRNNQKSWWPCGRVTLGP